MRKNLIVLFGAVLVACAPVHEMRWVKPVSQEEANQDSYACLREAQQRVSRAVITQWGGGSRDEVITNRDLFNACMAARGYTYRQVR